jgi:hypothetical protein
VRRAIVSGDPAGVRCRLAALSRALDAQGARRIIFVLSKPPHFIESFADALQFCTKWALLVDRQRRLIRRSEARLVEHQGNAGRPLAGKAVNAQQDIAASGIGKINAILSHTSQNSKVLASDELKVDQYWAAQSR